MDIVELLGGAVNRQASDIFLVAGMPLSYKVGGRIEYYEDKKLFPDQIDEMVTQLYKTAGNRSMMRIQETGDDDFSFALPSSPVSAPMCSDREALWRRLSVLSLLNCRIMRSFIFPEPSSTWRR